MSFVVFMVYLIVLAGACAGSWKGALYWHNRTRGPQHEDPRDQEIRELAAALSVSRRAEERLGLEQKNQEKQAWELQEKLRKTSDAYANVQQKYNATKETLNREIEDKSELDEEVTQLRRDNEEALGRVEELEVQARAALNGGMVAGLDIMDEDEHALAAARHEISELHGEVAKWKQHCTVMSETNKSLRAEVAQLSSTENTTAPPLAAHDDVVAESAATIEEKPGDVCDEADSSEALTDSVKALSDDNIDAMSADEPADTVEDDGLQRDDLQSIRGVGSKLEQKLNLLGIFSYKEILSLENDDYERANLVIPNLQSRIERDAWQEQARALHLEKYNELI